MTASVQVMTPAERRARRRAANRTRMYVGLMQQAAGRPMARLARACEYLRAVATALPAGQVEDYARRVTAMAEEANPK